MKTIADFIFIILSVALFPVSYKKGSLKTHESQVIEYKSDSVFGKPNYGRQINSDTWNLHDTIEKNHFKR